ncbi:MAG: hypothetical protein ABSF69_19140 [Polyangiaceae bacterium]|jgi:hypothetical protein
MNATIRHGALAASVVAGFGIVAGGCLSRPVATSEPQTSTNFTSTVRNQSVDKIDILFDIDNSASMGDKQTYLAQAIPDLISRLLTPNCVDNATGTISSGPSTIANGVASCEAYPNTQPEFPAVHNMHLGIVTSSLGQRLSDQQPGQGGEIICQTTLMAAAPFQNLSAHNDDQGHLIARSLTYGAGMATATEGSVANAVVASYMPTPSGFLDWFPMTAANTGTANPLPAGLMPEASQATLVSDFTEMVQGAGIYGCGIESQLESWYRFLVQPDPYASLVVNTVMVNGAAQPEAAWANGVDTTILQERADFLRPDSLVAVIVLSDENDSEIDVRSLGGAGYLFMGAGFNPPMGTAACTGVNGPSDPNCTTSGNTGTRYTALNDWGYDPNLRHVHMRAKYGIDPQYPWQRYVIGLSSPVVPDRAGEYPTGASYYVGTNDCTNPLFAATLPSGATLTGSITAATLCNLPVGTRTSDLIFYAIIGGVPNKLLHFDPNSAQNSQLNQKDWVRILGEGPATVTISTPSNDPSNFDYNGIDPHMYESYADRTTITGVTFDSGGTNPLAAANSANGADATNGREWTTNMPYVATSMTPYAPHVLPVDRQYACIFPLATPRDCTQAQNNYQCDCPNVATGLTPDEVPPLCNAQTVTQQVSAKAYPTIRELQVARLLGNQGIVSSLCPIDVADNATGDDPNYGYRPAVATIINRLKNALTNQCLPEPLAAGTGGSAAVPCLILVQMPATNGGSCLNPTCTAGGLSTPESAVLTKFCATAEATFMSNGGKSSGLQDPAAQSVCVLQQLIPTGTSSLGVKASAADFTNGSCDSETTDPGWCYVTGVKGCAQAIIFPTGSPPEGATASLQCIEQSITTAGAGH